MDTAEFKDYWEPECESALGTREEAGEPKLLCDEPVESYNAAYERQQEAN